MHYILQLRYLKKKSDSQGGLNAIYKRHIWFTEVEKIESERMKKDNQAKTTPNKVI